ncbi:SDR family oxidoreductase [Cupriavidus taiwanensis]|uniref:SDR family oxidoreductase n=1 Tax=Cupriavidus taiwanensis TaxID=164546 RepID=UPI000E1AA3EE|nr:SDR family oxidoreductase [Cupriavidus taiwanensis]SOZ29619.1 conserved hypothetical protein [Cupriavidus taiwanensis]SPA34451.1 conserved hypothetical protein [Cupriavidus taiwanensis]
MTEMVNKHVFITGAASGIGYGIAQAFGKTESRITIADISDGRREDAASRLRAAGLQICSVHLDVASAPSWDAAVATAETMYGPIDILCNNAGIIQSSRKDGSPIMPTDMAEDQLRVLFDVNVFGVFLGVKAVAPGMKERRSGHIVNTASLGGLIAPGNLGGYCASKYAAVGLSEALRHELAEYGIGVSILCPAGVQSELFTTSAVHRELALGNRVNEDRQLMTHRPVNLEVMRALSVGERVVQAVAANEMYILTHPEYAPLLEERFEALRAAVGESAEPGHKDPHSLYLASRNPCYTLAAHQRN